MVLIMEWDTLMFSWRCAECKKTCLVHSKVRESMLKPQQCPGSLPRKLCYQKGIQHMWPQRAQQLPFPSFLVQNHKIVVVDMDLCRSASPTSMLKAESARAGFLRDVPHHFLNISKQGEFTASRQSIPMSDHYHSKKRGGRGEVCIKWYFPCLNLGPLLLVLSLGYPEKSLALVLSPLLLHQVFIHIGKTPCGAFSF